MSKCSTCLLPSQLHNVVCIGKWARQSEYLVTIYPACTRWQYTWYCAMLTPVETCSKQRQGCNCMQLLHAQQSSQARQHSLGGYITHAGLTIISIACCKDSNCCSPAALNTDSRRLPLLTRYLSGSNRGWQRASSQKTTRTCVAVAEDSHSFFDMQMELSMMPVAYGGTATVGRQPLERG